jgi:hypothetical protein
MSSDNYGHVVIDAREDEWRDFWTAAYRRERLPKSTETTAEMS